MGSYIGYFSLFEVGTLTATTTDTGFSVNNLKDKRDYTYWQSSNTSDQTLELDLSATAYSASPVRYLAFAGHNLYTASATVHLDGYNGSSWIDDILSFDPGSDNPVMKTFAAITYSKYRVRLTGLAAKARIGVIGLGAVVQFDYPPDAPFSHKDYTGIVKGETSVKGNILGLSWDYTEHKITAKYSWLTKTFFTNYWDTFYRTHAQYGLPFFYAWDYTNDPDTCYYVRMEEPRTSMPQVTSNLIEGLEFTMIGKYM